MMIASILVPNNSYYYEKCSQLTGNINIYMSNPKYICFVTSEEIPLSIKEELVPAIFETGFEEPIRANPHYYSRIEDIYQPETNRELMSIRSRLVYAISENLAPNEFFVKLINEPNADQTARPYKYELRYRDVPCLVTQDLIELLTEAAGSTLGPLIVSTFSLSSIQAPLWYIRETFRDIIEMNEIDMSDKVLVLGTFTDELYLFYSEPVNITDDIIIELTTQIQGQIYTNIQLKLFPRATPEKQVYSKQLKLLPSKQWTISYPIPKNTPILADRFKTQFQLKDISHLFWVLLELQLSPTGSFIEKELTINLYPNQIIVQYETEYLPDFIRVINSSTINLESANLPLDFTVEIIYPEIIKNIFEYKLKDNSVRLNFYDSIHNEIATLSASSGSKEAGYWKPPLIKRVQITDYSLESRVKVDRDIGNIISFSDILKIKQA